jgi:hypothetical protein
MAETGRVRKTIWAQQSFDGLHVWDKTGLSGYLVCLIHLVSLMQPNKPDRPNRPHEQDRLADFFSILLRGPRPSVEEAHSKTSCCHARRKHRTDYPTGREAHSPRFTTAELSTQIRHMGFRPEPFIL